VNDAQNIEVADDGRDEEQDIVEVDVAAAEKENQKELKTATSDPFQEQVKQALEEAKSSDQTNTEEQRQVADLSSQVNEVPKTDIKKLDMKASLGFSGFPAENSSEAENPSSAVEQPTDPFSVYDAEFDEMVLTSGTAGLGRIPQRGSTRSVFAYTENKERLPQISDGKEIL